MTAQLTNCTLQVLFIFQVENCASLTFMLCKVKEDILE